jgi:putative glutamine amidotransferase
LSRPVIGITGPDRGGLAAWFCASWAARLAGGRPLRITPARPAAIEQLDALVVGGGADVDPSLYGEAVVSPALGDLRRRSRSLGRFLATLLLFPLIWLLRRMLSTKQLRKGDTARDELELDLLKQALARDMPILGICRGAQLLNVACGGCLHQDLSDFYNEAPNLWTIWPQKEVVIDDESRLSATMERIRCRVNSLHRQAIRETGDHLRVVAWEDNGVVQAIEHTDHPYVIGVQWHPEYLPQRREQRALFKRLVAEARGSAAA